jgi:hypothetical protein
MILSLRKRHRRIFTVLTVFLPIVFAVGMAARRPVPAVRTLPKDIVGSQPVFPYTLWGRNDLFRRTSIDLGLLREDKDRGRYAFSFTAPIDFAKPDLIVYWINGDSTNTITLPVNAVLLGAFDPQRPLVIPDRIPDHTGELLLYSLADGEVVDVSKPFVAADVTRRMGANTNNRNVHLFTSPAMHSKS